MKLKKLLSATSIGLMAIMYLVPLSGNAQQPTATHEPGNKAQTILVEVGGPGFISANYDFRFGQTRNAWGGRAGVGYISAGGAGLLTIPVQVNYLLGKGGHYFEMGAGATYTVATLEISYDEERSKAYGDGLMGTMTFGYRKQPVEGGFNFRAGISPVFRKDYFLPYLPYLSVGYSF